MNEHPHGPADDPAMAKADFLAALVLGALGLVFVVAGWTMDRLEIRSIHPLSVPGLVPGLLGGALVVCSALLGVQAVRKHALERWRDVRLLGQDAEAGAHTRLALALLLTLTYALLLIGTLPYWLATWLFVAGFVIVFERLQPDQPAPFWRTALVGLALGGVVALAVSFVFQELFLVRLP